MAESERAVGAVFRPEGLTSTYVLCPSDLSVPNLEVLEYIRILDKRVVDKLERLEGWKCYRKDTKVELDSIFKLVNVTEDYSYL